MALATGGYVGYLPKAPGTWGTLVAIPVHLLIVRMEPLFYYFILALIVLTAIIISGMAEKIIDHKDPGIVVIDEIAGMLVALIGVPVTPLYLAAGFVLFRIFDIWKPFPIRYIDKHINGGTGIVLDDLLAGCFTLFILRGWMMAGPLFGF